MTTLQTITTIARYESKTLMRGWFFRIFAAIALIFVFFFDLVGFTTIGDGGWPGRTIPGSVPYMNLFILNITQAVIAIFLSSDFLGRDKKLDTTEAFYVRSMSNYAYVIGKTLGILKVFLILNLLVLLIGFVFNLVAVDINFFPLTYLVYPLLLSIPTLLLVLGLSFLLMVLIKNQAVVFVLMLGFLGVTLFFLGGKLYNTMDFIGYNMPMVYSVFTGFPQLASLVLLRMAYGLLGIAFVLLTVLMLPRLPQERYFKLKMSIGALVSGVAAIIIVGTYYYQQKSNEALRAKIISIEQQLPHQFSHMVESNLLEVEHLGHQIKVKSNMTVSSQKDGELQFILNPGFKVSEVLVDGSSGEYNMELHVLSFKSSKIKRGAKCVVELAYSGKPNDAATFVDIPENVRIESNRLDPLVAGKELSFVQPAYLLLTREAGWYPVAASRDFRSKPQFTYFEVKIKGNHQHYVLSQGQRVANENGWVHFKSDKPLNALSLLSGLYDVYTVKVDSVEVSFLQHPRNKQTLASFDLITDTISSILMDMKRDYERRLGTSYPFKEFSLVEVPVHFYTYPRSWTLATEDNMPGMVFYNERGAGNFQNDLARQKRRIERDNERNNQGLLPKEIQAQLFRNTVGNMIFSPMQMFRFSGTNLRNLSGWGKQTVFPQYFAYTNGIVQDGFPILQFITENYLFARVQSGGRGGFGPNEGVSDQVILKMKGKNLLQLLDSMKHDAQLPDVISKKGNQFFKTIEMRIKPKEIDVVLDGILEQNRFGQLFDSLFVNELSKLSGTDMTEAIDEWMRNASMPAFLFGKTTAYEIKDGDRVRYFVKTQVLNDGDGYGVISIGLRSQMRDRGGRGGGFGGGFGGFGGRGGPAPSVENTYTLAKGQKVEIGIFSDSEPRELVINTYVAENIPSSQRLGIEIIQNQSITPFEGMRDYAGIISVAEKFETIVDNEDEGFSTKNQSESKTIKDWWMARNNASEDLTSDKYQTIRFWSPSPKWQATLSTNYFGKYIKSAVYKRSGNGDAQAQWLGNLTESGNYTIYAYIPQQRRGGGPRRDQNDEKGTYLFTVSHDDGDTPIEIDPSNEQGGWIYLGDFYISQGEAKVVLSDKSERNFVVADAIKWSKKR